MVSVPSGRWAPCCSHEPIGISTMSDRCWNHSMSGGARSSRQWETGRESDGTRRLRDEGQVAGGHEVRELRIVDVRVDGLVGDVRAQAVLQRVEERAVGLRIPEVAA